jgi:hypothetical protein
MTREEIDVLADKIARTINGRVGFGSKHMVHYVTDGSQVANIRRNMEMSDIRQAAEIIADAIAASQKGC